MVEYNLPSEKGRDKFKWYEGENIKQMPVLRAEGRVPMNTSQLMQRKLDLRNGPAEVKTAWMDNFFNTSDMVIYHPNGDVKIVYTTDDDGSLTSEGKILLPMVAPENKRNSITGALVLGEDVYKTLLYSRN
jgi:phosphoribosylformylglycinamidine (FGAM) synthase-like amidotransferase family enzyme